MSDRVIRLAVLTATVAFASAWGWSQVGVAAEATAAQRPIKFEDLARMKQVSDPQISPSGKWVVFSVAETDLDRNVIVNHLWVVPLEGATAATASESHERQITFTKDGESGGRLSPDGKMLLFVANDEEAGRSQIFVAPWDDRAGKPGTPKRLTSVITGADGAVWSPDSQRILFTSQVYPECSDEAAWATENACDKTRDEANGVSPMKAQVLDHLQYLRPDQEVGPKRSHMLVVFAANGDAIRDLTPRRSIGEADIAAFSSDGRIGYAWAPDSMEVAFVTSSNRFSAATTNNEVFILRLNNAGARPEKVSRPAGSDEAPAYSPDGKWLAFRSQARAEYSSTQFRLVLFDRQMGTTTVVLPHFDRSINEFTWASDSASIFFAIHDRGEGQIYSVAVADENTIHYIAVPTGHLTLLVSETKSNFSELQISNDGTWLVSSATNVERPSEIFRTSLRILADEDPEVKKKTIGLKLAIAADKTAPPIDSAVPVVPEALTHLNNKMLDRIALEKMESFWFTGADGAKMQGFVIRPPGFDSARRYPVKFLIHENPYRAWGDNWSYRWNPELMAASGYVVVMVNPRGSIGYGHAFIDGMNGDWGGKAYVDLMKGMDYAEQHYGFIDKTRECALGAGFGGFMADWILTHTNRFACIVTQDGIFNPDAEYGTSAEPRLNGENSPAKDAKDVKSARNESSAQDPSQKWSPMLSIRNAKTPTLIVHSGNRLDVSESTQLFKALQQLNVQSSILSLPGTGHWLNRPQDSRLWYESVADWCDRWTRTNRYAAGFSQPALTATVSESKKLPLKPQSIPVPSQSAASTMTEPAKPQPQLSLPTKSAESTIQRVPTPVPSAPVRAATAPPEVQSRPQAVPTPIAPVVTPDVLVIPKPQPDLQATNPVIPRIVLPTEPPKPEAAPVASAIHNTSQGSFVIAINAPADELRVGEDARVLITLTNVSGHPILFSHRVGTENPEFSFIFLVRNSTGRLMGENIAGGLRASDPLQVDQVPSGGTLTQTAHLSRLVNLSQPGRYTVRVYRRDVDTNQVVQSNEVMLNIGTSMHAR
ncbi:prolyl oligopeptidase family serine peptidase [Tunturibacter empetritectus]|uniref:Dipeptidyl aminopeptidase/acylaminoacyl peptidase n=1 Tax=Tunturiibacter empetritectus TaxID=3069691 RepID=A0A7W8IL23_9BACT|nr:prolyl oligopeptidase family serine peptidase [Edaphobacter lichenicola]MBB5318173.1 dipeptidyl aminopeptidase/acylaminoacyl peptidase [Edaphobacter lichenicola]